MDGGLVERAAPGDHDAFGVLVRQSSDRLFAIAYRIAGPYLERNAV